MAIMQRFGELFERRVGIALANLAGDIASPEITLRLNSACVCGMPDVIYGVILFARRAYFLNHGPTNGEEL
jgi:hypothetical protein